MTRWLWLALWAFCACTTSETRKAGRADAGVTPAGWRLADGGQGAALPRGKARVADVYGGMKQLELEIAASDPARQRGMMFRTEMKDTEGMLFIFSRDQVQTFWMKNTLIPLDMLFIDAARRVVGIVERAEPQTLIPRSVGVPSRYVLEVPGGWAARMGVKVGAQVELELPARLIID